MRHAFLTALAQSRFRIHKPSDKQYCAGKRKQCERNGYMGGLGALMEVTVMNGDCLLRCTACGWVCAGTRSVPDCRAWATTSRWIEVRSHVSCDCMQCVSPCRLLPSSASSCSSLHIKEGLVRPVRQGDCHQRHRSQGLAKMRFLAAWRSGEVHPPRCSFPTRAALRAPVRPVSHANQRRGQTSMVHG